MSTGEGIDLVTGFPDVGLARRLTFALLDERPARQLVCIVHRERRKRAEELLHDLPASKRDRIAFLEGSPYGLDLGLSGKEWKRLASQVVRIHHASQITTSGLETDEAMRVNRGSTVEVLELARHASSLERLVVWSSAAVSGERRGFVLEDELDLRIPARSPVEESLRRSESLLRAAMGELPITILRPGICAGDSKTGEVDRREGMYLLIAMMVTAPRDRPMPMPADPDSPLALVPIDHVVRAGLRIASDSRSIRRTFHLVDPDPLTAGRVFELLARAVGRDLPRPILPPFLASRLMRLPMIQPGGAEPLPSAFLGQLATETIHDDHGARQLLADTGIVCPSFESYVNALVRYVREETLGAPRVPATGREERDERL